MNTVLDALPGLVVPFLLRLTLPPLLSLIVGIALVVWSVRTFRRKGFTATMSAIAIGGVLVLVVPLVTTYFSVKYAVAAGVARAASRGGELAAWAVRSGLETISADAGIQQAGNRLDPRALIGQVEQARAEAERQLEGLPVDELLAMASTGSLNPEALSQLPASQVPALVECAFWRVLDDTLRSHSVTGEGVTWDRLTADVADRLDTKVQGLLQGIQETFRSAALSALLVILAVNLLADGGAVLATLLLCQSHSAPIASPF